MKSQLRILEIPAFFPPYGGEFCLDQAKALQQLGHEVTVLSVVQLSIKKSKEQFFTLPYGLHRFEMDGVEVWQRFTRGIPKVIRPNVMHWINVCVSLIEEYISECGKPDVIHAHCGKWSGCAARVIKEKHGVPYVLTEHLAMKLLEEDFRLTGGRDSWMIPMLKECYEEASLVMPVSRELIKDMQPYFGDKFIWKEQCNMIDTGFYTYLEHRKVSDKEPIRLLCLAHYTYLKGYDLLFNALKDLENRAEGTDFSKEIELHIAGRATDSGQFHDLISKYSLRTKIIIHGLLDREQVREQLYFCDALVLPTRAEVHPLVILEAISAGIPAIITEACPKHTLPEGSYIPVTLDTISSGLLQLRAFLKTYDAEKASRYVGENLSMQAIGRSIERNILEALEGAVVKG